MADYQDIRGLRVKYLSGDPSVTVGGEVWYNSTTGTLRSQLVLAAWSGGANSVLAKSYRFGGGTPTATFAAGGSPGVATTEEYDGTGWSVGGDLGTARYEGGSAGTLTAGLAFGGYVDPNGYKNETEEYDGSSWSEQNNLNTARYSQGGFGIQTAAVYSNGNAGGTIDACEEYDGSSWSEVNNSTLSRNDVGTAGTLTAGMIFGGQGNDVPTVTGVTELYDGTNWTTGPTMNNARSQLGGTGVQTAALAFGGRFTPPGSVLRAYTESFDGTSWSETADLATARRQLSSPRSNTGNSASLAFGGAAPSQTNATEEWNISTSAITAGAWASGGALPTVLFRGASFGTLTAGATTGGDNTDAQPSVTTTSEYDGSTWTVGGVLATARRGLAASGVQTLGLAFGGSDGASDTNVTGVTEEYGGTSWTTSPGSLNTARSAISGDGTQGASIAAGGYLGPPTANSDSAETYNGATWTAITNIPSVRRWPTTSGTTTAALVSGGETAPGTQLTTVSEWDGSSWSEGGALLVTTSAAASAGTQTDALFFAGRNPAVSLASYAYDGSAWSTRPSMATARSMVAGTGVSTSAFVCGGEIGPGPLQDLTENFTGETTAANIETLTTS